MNDGGGSIALNPGKSMYIYGNTIYKSSTASPAYASLSTPPSCFSVGYNGNYNGINFVADNLCINTTTGGSSGKTRFIDGGSGAGGLAAINIQNNVYFNGSGSTSEYVWSGTYASLTALRAAVAAEANSVEVDPQIVSGGTGGNLRANHGCAALPDWLQAQVDLPAHRQGFGLDEGTIRADSSSRLLRDGDPGDRREHRRLSRPRPLE